MCVMLKDGTIPFCNMSVVFSQCRQLKHAPAITGAWQDERSSVGSTRWTYLFATVDGGTNLPKLRCSLDLGAEVWN